MTQEDQNHIGEPDQNGEAESAQDLQTSAESREDALQAEIERLRDEAANWQDKYLRKLAEFDNFRKRTRQESEMVGQLVTESLIISLLPIMDDFDRMLAKLENMDDPYRKGAEMMRDKFRAFLDVRNVMQFECIGKPFDPGEHDALMTRPTPDFPAGTVLEIITPGYKMGERILRHAQVVVSAEPEDEQSA